MRFIGWRVVEGLAVGGLLVAGAPAFAKSASGSGSSEAPRTLQPSSSIHQVAGKIESFDAGSKELTLDSGTKLKIDAGTSVTKYGDQAPLSDIREGDRILASYSGSGNGGDAISIDVIPRDNRKPGGSAR